MQLAKRLRARQRIRTASARCQARAVNAAQPDVRHPHRLYKMKLGELITTIPTIGFNVETVKYKNLQMVRSTDLEGTSRPVL